MAVYGILIGVKKSKIAQGFGYLLRKKDINNVRSSHDHPFQVEL